MDKRISSVTSIFLTQQEIEHQNENKEHVKYLKKQIKRHDKLLNHYSKRIESQENVIQHLINYLAEVKQANEVKNKKTSSVSSDQTRKNVVTNNLVTDDSNRDQPDQLDSNSSSNISDTASVCSGRPSGRTDTIIRVPSNISVASSVSSRTDTIRMPPSPTLSNRSSFDYENDMKKFVGVRVPGRSELGPILSCTKENCWRYHHAHSMHHVDQKWSLICGANRDGKIVSQPVLLPVNGGLAVSIWLFPKSKQEFEIRIFGFQFPENEKKVPAEFSVKVSAYMSNQKIQEKGFKEFSFSKDLDKYADTKDKKPFLFPVLRSAKLPKLVFEFAA